MPYRYKASTQDKLSGWGPNLSLLLTVFIKSTKVQN